jgi:tetratricopeptide (TPR) repeat protein
MKYHLLIPLLKSPQKSDLMSGQKRYCEFESHGAMANLLAQYEPATENWRLEKKGPFWDAVKRAHQAGQHGLGSRVAVIDSSCDFSIPQIYRQTGGRPKLPGPSGEPTDHGTLVSLLIGAVAPECNMDIYEISRNGEPDINAVEKAINLAAKSNADIICLSLGSPIDIELKEKYVEALRRKDILTYFKMSIEDDGQIAEREEPACSLCKAASQAVKKGKMVFAAVGNDKGAAYCPALHTDVVSSGFQLVTKSVVAADYGGYREVAYGNLPNFNQSLLSDYTVMQLPGALGSSFACPLIAGAATLGIKQEELKKFLISSSLTSTADALQPLLSSESPRELIDLVKHAYQKAFQKHPHQHLKPGGAAGCIGCSFFSLQLYCNGGLFNLNTGNYDIAESFLRVARWFAPWSCDAAANLGRTLQAQAEKILSIENDIVHAQKLLDESIQHYTDALTIRPGFPPYQNQLEEIIQLRNSMF